MVVRNRYKLGEFTIAIVVVLTCYFRHLKQVFEKAGINVTSENRKEVDKIIHSIVDVEYKNCPSAWREVKKRILENEKVFASKLKEEWSKRIRSS